jgi:hypothetical protein
MRSVGMILALATVGAAALACSGTSGGGAGGGHGSSGSGGSGGSGGASSCVASSLGPASGCASCVESQCGTELSAVESGCGDYDACICPGGTFDPSLVQQCSSKKTESSCVDALGPLGGCVEQKCKTQCGGGSSDAGMDAPPDDSPSDGNTGGYVRVSCLEVGAFECESQEVPANLASVYRSMCGSPSTHCPTTPTPVGPFVGCCVPPGSGQIVTCFYSSDAMAIAMYKSTCMGTWSMTPP